MFHYPFEIVCLTSLQRAEAAAPEIRRLNPRVKVSTITRDLRAEQDVPFFKAYDVVIATDLDFLSFRNLDTVVRFCKRPFYGAAAHGFYGYIFADLGIHDFIIEREKSNRPTKVGRETLTRAVLGTTEKKENGKIIEMVTKREVYSALTSAHTSPLPLEIAGNLRKLRKVHPLLTCIRTLWDYQENSHGILPSSTSSTSNANLEIFTTLATQKHKELKLPAETLKSEFLRSFLQNVGSELAPVTAFLGGQLAQDVINVLAKREQPLQNLMLFDGETFSAPVYAMHQANFDNNAPVPALPAPVAGAAMVI
jgi:ubiquitin-like 1-activating enzyme E1 A